MDDARASSSSSQRSQAAAVQGQRSGIAIVPRTADDLAALARIFEATFETSGYPVDGPPALDPAAAPALVEYLSGPPAQERGGFVAVGDGDVRTTTTEGDSSAQTPTSPPRRKVLSHVSLRRVHPHSIETRLWNAFRRGAPTTTTPAATPAATDSCLWGVSRLAIDPAEQKRGVGGRLMDYVE